MAEKNIYEKAALQIFQRIVPMTSFTPAVSDALELLCPTYPPTDETLVEVNAEPISTVLDRIAGRPYPVVCKLVRCLAGMLAYGLREVDSEQSQALVDKFCKTFSEVSAEFKAKLVENQSGRFPTPSLPKKYETMASANTGCTKFFKCEDKYGISIDSLTPLEEFQLGQKLHAITSTRHGFRRRDVPTWRSEDPAPVMLQVLRSIGVHHRVFSRQRSPKTSKLVCERPILRLDVKSRANARNSHTRDALKKPRNSKPKSSRNIALVNQRWTTVMVLAPNHATALVHDGNSRAGSTLNPRYLSKAWKFMLKVWHFHMSDLNILTYAYYRNLEPSLCKIQMCQSRERRCLLNNTAP